MTLLVLGALLDPANVLLELPHFDHELSLLYFTPRRTFNQFTPLFCL